jgi:hypothetical protein
MKQAVEVIGLIDIEAFTFLNKWLTDGSGVVSLICQPDFIAQEHVWYHFLVEDD